MLAVEVVAAATLSCFVTCAASYWARRRRLRRLLRQASGHADPDRRLAALFIAALDGISHHIDLVVERALNEEADVVLSSLVDLVMEAEWKDDRDGRVSALVAWAKEFAAEEPEVQGAGAPPDGHGCRPFDSIDALELTEFVAVVEPGPLTRPTRARVKTWVRGDDGPEIDALEVIEHLVGQKRRLPQRAATSLATDGLDTSLEALIAEVLTSPRERERALGPVRSYAPAS